METKIIAIDGYKVRYVDVEWKNWYCMQDIIALAKKVKLPKDCIKRYLQHNPQFKFQWNINAKMYPIQTNWWKQLMYCATREGIVEILWTIGAKINVVNFVVK